MNLMRLFNKNYLLQNLKKSKVVLSIFTCLIPILNTIILTMMLTNNSNHVLGFVEISIINLIGIYILPIIISICLFNYIYKKKSVDFINSMPISRKSIFVTNTILGVVIFIVMLLVNILLISVVCLIFNTQVPVMMLVDYFWFFALVYIFSFSATNLAMTVSGNAITQIIVTLLIFFLVPFAHAYTKALYEFNTNSNILLHCTTEECMPETYYCYDDLECNINKKLNKYEISASELKEINYTTPFGLLYNSVINEGQLINTTSTIKMLILSIIYTILGYILFVRRKMEISETSFKNIHIHNLVKSLTLVPIVAFSYIIFRYESTIYIIFLIVIMLIYYFVYDLITRKSITHIRLSLIYFTIALTLLTITFNILDQNNEENTVIKYNDIKEVAINIITYSGRNSSNKIYLNNKELISIVTKEMLNEKDYSSNTQNITIYLKTKEGEEYQTYITVTDDIYNKIIAILSDEKEYINYYKNINLDEVYALKIGNKIYKSSEAEEYLDLIETSIKDLSLKEFLELQQKYNNVSDDFFIDLYTYENHEKRDFSINGYINYDLLNSIVNSNNSLLKENITNIIPNNYSVYYVNSYLENEYEIDYFVLKSAKNEIYNFILDEVDKTVDMKREYIALEIYLNGTSYQFTTNNTSKFIEILNNKYNEIKDTDEYKTYSNPYQKESVDYYD